MFKKFNKRLLLLYKATYQILENQISIMLYLKKECYLNVHNNEPHKRDFDNISNQIKSSDILSERLKDTINEFKK